MQGRTWSSERDEDPAPGVPGGVSHTLYTPINWYMFGADFMVDEAAQPWLIEINSCLSGLWGFERTVVRSHDTALRIMLTRRRRDQGNTSYHPRACGNADAVDGERAGGAGRHRLARFTVI